MKHDAAAYFVLTLFHARTDAHIMHLKTKSYSEHMALNGFYDALPDLVDAFVEAYQGKYGVIEEYPKFYRPLYAIEDLIDEVSICRKELPQDSELQNEIDNIANLINSTVYKLKNLK